MGLLHPTQVCSPHQCPPSSRGHTQVLRPGPSGCLDLHRPVHVPAYSFSLNHKPPPHPHSSPTLGSQDLGVS